MSILDKLSFKNQAFKLREQSILDATTQLLASKGFDLITMDDVANQVGISKPSLYKHFKSKDELVIEVMVRLLDGALDYLAQQPTTLTPLERLSSLLEWALRVRLTGGLPFLPSGSAQVREILTRNLRYITRVLKLNSQLGQMVDACKQAGLLRMDLPNEVILFSYYSRTCDPAVDYLRLYAKLTDEDIVRYMLSVWLEGIRLPSRS